ncbi:hypothetical protein FKM82_021536 [Ascaphus truei]
MKLPTGSRVQGDVRTPACKSGSPLRRTADTLTLHYCAMLAPWRSADPQGGMNAVPPSCSEELSSSWDPLSGNPALPLSLSLSAIGRR